MVARAAAAAVAPLGDLPHAAWAWEPLLRGPAPAAPEAVEGSLVGQVFPEASPPAPG